MKPKFLDNDVLWFITRKMKNYLRTPPSMSYKTSGAVLVMILVGTLVMMLFACLRANGDDLFKGSQKSSVIECDSFDSAENGEMVDFTVYLKNPYEARKDTVVGKMPMDQNEHLILSGTEIIWHGKYRIQDKKMPTAFVYFQKGSYYNENTKRHYYNITCSTLTDKLHDINQKGLLNGSETSNIAVLASNDSSEVYLQQQNNSVVDLACTNLRVYEPYGCEGRVDVSAKFNKFFFGEDEIVEKLPWGENDILVASGDDVIWYGSFKLSEFQKFYENSILISRNTNGSILKIYNLKCPTLNPLLEKHSSNFWANRQYIDGLKISAYSLYFSIWGFLLGWISSDFITRLALFGKLVKLAPWCTT